MYKGIKIYMIGITPETTVVHADELAPFVGGWLQATDFYLTLKQQAFADGLVIVEEIGGQRGPQKVVRGKELVEYNGEVIRNVALL